MNKFKYIAALLSFFSIFGPIHGADREDIKIAPSKVNKSKKITVASPAKKIVILDENYHDPRVAEEHRRIIRLTPQNPGSSWNHPGQNIFSLPNNEWWAKRLVPCSYLDLNDNKLSFLPDEVCLWKNLKSIALENNLFEEMPPQIFTIGKEATGGTVSVFFSNNPIKKISPQFWEKMLSIRNCFHKGSGLDIVLDQNVIDTVLLPIVATDPKIKEHLMLSANYNSSRHASSEKLIQNGFCVFQNQRGQHLYFQKDGTPFMSS